MKKENNKPKVHPETRAFVDSDWDISLYKTLQRVYEQSIDKESVDIALFKCGACASSNIEFDNGWGLGSVAGTHEWKEFHCLDCQCYTLFEKETD